MNTQRAVVGAFLLVLSGCPSTPPAGDDGGTVTGGGGGGAVTGGGGGTQTTGSALRFEAASFSFDAVTVGAPATSHTFTVTNGGDDATGALTVSVAGDGFTVSGKTCTAALGAAGTCTIDVSFAPTTVGTRSGRLSVGDGVKASASVALLGSSLAPATISVVGTTTDFGAVLVGTPVIKTFTVTNTGEAPAAMLASTFTGAQAAAFEVVAPSGTDCTAGGMVAAGGTCTVQVKLTPTAGAQRAVLHVAATPGGEALLSLQGVGLRPALLSSAATMHDFGEQESGVVSETWDWVITNDGDVPSGVVAVTVAAPISKGTDTCNGRAIQPGQSCIVGLAITPLYGTTLTDPTLTATPGGSLTVQLTVTPMVRLTLSASNGGRVRTIDGRLDCGASSCSALYGPTASVQVEAVNANGSTVHFARWVEVDTLGYGSACLFNGTGQTCGFDLYGSTNLRAEFQQKRGNLIFVASGAAPNDGIAALDRRCNSLASAAGINTVAGDGFVAWLSTPSLPLNSRWTVTGGLERVDGRAFAASRADVFAGRIVNPNELDERGRRVTGQVFTGTNADGTTAALNCNSWTTAAVGQQATGGNVSRGGLDWASGIQVACVDPTVQFVCVENTSAGVVINAALPAGAKLIYRTAPVARPATRAAADAICAANKPPFATSRTFVALLATVGTSASSRLNQQAVYFRPDGERVGVGYELGSGRIETGVWAFADGSLQTTEASVWSGAESVGALGTNATTCNDWTSSTGTVALGSSGYANAAFFGSSLTTGCSGTAALYCVEP